MRLYRAALARFAAGANVRDPLHVHGMAVAFETVSLLRRVGASPTRAGAHGAGALDHERGQPVPAPRDRGAHVARGRVPGPAGPARSLAERPLAAVRRPLVELDVRDLEHLDREAGALRDLAREADRLVPIGHVHDVEAAERLLRLRERAVGDDRLLAGSDDRRVPGPASASPET